MNIAAPEAAAAGMTWPTLSLHSLRRSFLTGNGAFVHALADVTINVAKNEVLAVIGPSGCGKSSLLRVLAGLDEDYDGQIRWPDDVQDSQRLRSATVFQGDSTFPWMTAAANVRIGLTGLSLTPAESERRIAHYLALVGMGQFANAYPHELSGGMRQRVAIARALATEPHLLLMDEPLSALDAQTRIVMQQELLRIWCTARATVVYITHDISEAVALADRVAIMTSRPGRIKKIVDIPFGSNRNVLDIRATSQFGELESELWRMIAEEVGEKL